MAYKFLREHLKSLGYPSEIAAQARLSVESAELFAMSQYKQNYIERAVRRQVKKSPSVDSPVKIPKVKDREARLQERREHRQRVKEAQSFTKKLEHKRQAREQREYERNVDFARRQEEQRQEETRQREEQEKLKKEEHMKKFFELTEKISKKKEHSTPAYKVPKQVPLYRQMEEKYQASVLMPELEKKKADLEKKRLRVQPIDPKDIRDHAKKHDEMMKQIEKQRKMAIAEKEIESRIYMSSVQPSKFYFNLVEEDQKNILQELEKANHKKTLAEKRKHYACLVKEMFQPTVDPSKQQQMENLIEKTKPHQKSWSARSGLTEESRIPKRTWKKNPMLPEPKPKREPKVYDYLAERRKVRGNMTPSDNLDWENDILSQEINDEEKAARLKAAAAKIEYKVRQKEIKLGNLKETENNKEVSELLLSSIKAKLALFDKFSN